MSDVRKRAGARGLPTMGLASPALPPPPYVASYWFGSAGTLGHEALLSDTHVFDFPVVGMIASAPTPDWSAE